MGLSNGAHDVYPVGAESGNDLERVIVLERVKAFAYPI
jgi:hypothetical protein